MQHRFEISRVLLIVALSAMLVAAGTAQPRRDSTHLASVLTPNKKAAIAPTHGAQEATSLPITRVVLYKNGVGYFEHRGRVVGSQELAIRFTTAQLNDVLKSLTVVDLGGGKVSGARYNSVAPLAERLHTLRLSLDGNVDRVSLLNALRGVQVEVKNGAAAAIGKLFSVEETTRATKDGGAIKATMLTVVSDTGEMRSFELTPATSVRILDREMTSEVARYLALVASTRDPDVRRMTIATEGTGTRDLQVSYISEVPVWKSTYRIVLPQNASDKPLLQGWAIVDNTVGEDWRNVQLSLVAGAPQSFVEQLAQPYYVRRPIVELPKIAQSIPQTHEGTEPEVANEAVAAAPHAKSLARGIEGGAYGSAWSQDETDAATKTLAENAEATFAAQAAGAALGDMFSYTVAQPVTVLQNQSALVPMVQARVEAEKITLWNDRQKMPLRALWLRNTSGLTLDAGTFNILEDGVFAGEGLLDEIRPGERRLLSYAADPAVHVKVEGANETQHYTKLRAAHGVLIFTRELRRTTRYTVSNSAATARTVIVEHPMRSGWKFRDSQIRPEEMTNSSARFRLTVAPGTSSKLELAEAAPRESRYELTALDEATIEMILQTSTPQPEIEAALRKLLAKRSEIAAVERELATRRSESEAINKEQARMRENMKALKGSAEEKTLIARYVRQLNQQEDRLTALQSELAAKEKQKSALEAELEQMSQLLSFESGS